MSVREGFGRTTLDPQHSWLEAFDSQIRSEAFSRTDHPSHYTTHLVAELRLDGVQQRLVRGACLACLRTVHALRPQRQHVVVCAIAPRLRTPFVVYLSHN
jgi:hypothetical protein